MTEILGIKVSKIRGIKSTNGSKFKTICEDCNNRLGRNDDEISRLYKTLTPKINYYFQAANSPVSGVFTPLNVLNYSRAMIGHILAATSTTECYEPSEPTPYFDPLKKFVRGDDAAIDDTHDIYYWFYPHRHHLSIKIFHARNHGNQCSMSILAFFPLAFLVTEKGKGIYPAGATKMELSDSSLFLNLSLANVHYSNFPISELKGDQMVMYLDSRAIVSYPIQD